MPVVPVDVVRSVSGVLTIQASSGQCRNRRTRVVDLVVVFVEVEGRRDESRGSQVKSHQALASKASATRNPNTLLCKANQAHSSLTTVTYLRIQVDHALVFAPLFLTLRSAAEGSDPI